MRNSSSFCHNHMYITKEHIVSWEPEGRYQYSKMFPWEPEGRYCCTMSMAIAPFWFSTEYLWKVIAPFWLSTDDMPSFWRMLWLAWLNQIYLQIYLKKWWHNICSGDNCTGKNFPHKKKLECGLWLGFWFRV